MYKLKRAGFTLIELLVVIAIIGLLATLSVIALSNARAKSRDSKRLADVKQLQTSLEMYYLQNSHYPTANEFNSGSIFSTSSSNGTTTYMNIIPAAPEPNDGPCSVSGNGYVYTPIDNGLSYTISFCIGGGSNNLAAGQKCATPGGILNVDCGGSGGGGGGGEGGGGFACGEAVSYGGESYPTVSIGTQCWFAKNLNIGTMVAGADDQTNDSVLEKYCYNDNAADCTTYGALYQWSEALQLSSACNAVDCDSAPADPCCAFANPRQGICPSGWHIPTDIEQNTLDQYLTDSPNTCDAERFGPDCANAGSKLQSGGFAGLLAGYRFNVGSFGSQGMNAGFWSSSVSGISAWNRILASGLAAVVRLPSGRVPGISVRCLRD
jgi:uncharacterized protein (TIGR02145 family)/prepilin-type N-terminal cleavage/methylation domain-containing protein